MPILQAFNHEFNTLNTVVNRCLLISATTGQHYTVITVDQGLYFKLIELKWSISKYQDDMVIQPGSLHISMCFFKTIGQHINDSGLPDAWVESGILCTISAEHVQSGKAYKRAFMPIKSPCSRYAVVDSSTARVLRVALPRSSVRVIMSSC